MVADEKMISWITGNTGGNTLAALRHVVDEYPYFTAARVLLTKEMWAQKAEGYSVQMQQTALHFDEPLWLHYLLTAEIPHLTIQEVSQENIQWADTEEPALTDQATDATEEPVPPVENMSEEVLMGSRLTSILEAQKSEFEKPVQKEDKLQTEAEPLFKTDYFASQGIVYVKSQDQMGKKVRKFTDWLREVKRLSDGTPQLNTTEEEEKLAAAQAIASLKVEEILTESMAEALARQHKNDQAIVVYQKLSLLYPQKSTYFAHKIKSLE